MCFGEGGGVDAVAAEDAVEAKEDMELEPCERLTFLFGCRCEASDGASWTADAEAEGGEGWRCAEGDAGDAAPRTLL